jgi:hypothetical protein
MGRRALRSSLGTKDQSAARHTRRAGQLHGGGLHDHGENGAEAPARLPGGRQHTMINIEVVISYPGPVTEACTSGGSCTPAR